MRKPAILLFSMLFASIFSYSQSSLKGTVTDSVEKKTPANAVVSVMRSADSVLVKFARTDKDGHFQFNSLKTGKYIIMITHPYMGDYFDAIDLNAPIVDLGKVYVTPKSKLLAEVIIKSGAPIRIKGDTTVYTADSFKVRPGANVEELLRRLPGIQVDKNGQITAMGERVKKVLVDGEEFFGSDPGIATKNLRADVVKEVEVFDKKSDQAEFTGIDDGVKDKTINLKLKDDKKKGYFGKIEAGGGLPDKYNNSAMLNAFKGKRKLAAYGIMSNTGQTNLDWQDAQNYGGGSENMESGVSDDGGMWISMSSGDEDYWGGRNGIPTNWNGGLHFNNKYNNNKQSVNAGYKFSKVNAPGITSTFSKIFLNDTSWSTNSITDRFSSTVKHAFNLTAEFTLDSMNSLKWTSRFNNNNSRTTNDYLAEALDIDDKLINKNNRISNNESDNNNFTSTLLWRKKFKKLSRTLSVNTDFSWNNSKNDGLLFSRIDYYDKGVYLRYDSIDQQNIRNSEGKSFTTKAAYTEPLMKDTYLELSYAFNYYNNDNERITNVKDGTGKYTEEIDSLTNFFTFNRLVHTPGLNFRVNKKKYNFSFGSSVGFSHFIQKNITEELESEYNFTNYFPRASFTYKFKPSQNLRFNYNGSTTAPTLEQLQPTTVNTDPLNIYIGNPDLKQAFRHSFNAGYNSYNVLKEKNIWTNLSVNFTDNAFTQFSSIDSGVRTYQTVNVDGIYNLNFFGDYGFKIKDTKWRLGFGPTLNVNKNIDFVQQGGSPVAVKNVTKTNSYGLRINVSQYVENKFNFHIGPNFTWNRSHASVNTNANAEYWQINGWASGEATLPKGFDIGTDLNYQFRQKDDRFPTNNSFTTWNAFVRKRLLKENALELKFGVYDILNQNRGYNRNFNSYSFTETYYNTLRRFWLFTVTYNISKNGKPASGF
ncbi:MAG TPA: outer membrane beta-barrel family protein [Chitinophagaceae bacterium]